MAHRIVYKPQGIIFSSAIGDLRVSVDGSFVDVKLTTTGVTLLSERYYARGGEVTLYDFASLIESEMRQMGMSYQTFTLAVYGSSATPDDSCTLTVLYCDRYSVCTDIPNFLRENFLTTLDVRRVPANASQSLFFYAGQGESVAARVAYSVSDTEGVIRRGSYTLNSGKTAQSAGVEHIEISQSGILTKAASQLGIAKGSLSLLSFVVTIGQRSITYWIDRSLSDADSFYFRNCFNVFDVACLPDVTTAKTDVDRSTAIINGQSRFYNQSTTKTYEVKAEALTADEADWIDQLFTSYFVVRAVPNLCDDTDPYIVAEVLITDSTCEVHNDDEKLNEVKFTWRYADNRPLVHLSASKGIFTSPYNIVFS